MGKDRDEDYVDSLEEHLHHVHGEKMLTVEQEAINGFKQEALAHYKALNETQKLTFRRMGPGYAMQEIARKSLAVATLVIALSGPMTKDFGGGPDAAMVDAGIDGIELMGKRMRSPEEEELALIYEDATEFIKRWFLDNDDELKKFPECVGRAVAAAKEAVREDRFMKMFRGMFDGMIGQTHLSIFFNKVQLGEIKIKKKSAKLNLNGRIEDPKIV